MNLSDQRVPLVTVDIHVEDWPKMEPSKPAEYDTCAVCSKVADIPNDPLVFGPWAQSNGTEIWFDIQKFVWKSGAATVIGPVCNECLAELEWAGTIKEVPALECHLKSSHQAMIREFEISSSVSLEMDGYPTVTLPMAQWAEMFALLGDRFDKWADGIGFEEFEMKSAQVLKRDVERFDARVRIGHLLFEIEEFDPCDPRSDPLEGGVQIRPADDCFNSWSPELLELELSSEEDRNELREKEPFPSHIKLSNVDRVETYSVYDFIHSLQGLASDEEVDALVVRYSSMYDREYLRALPVEQLLPGILLVKRHDGALAVMGNFRETLLWEKLYIG